MVIIGSLQSHYVLFNLKVTSYLHSCHAGMIPHTKSYYRKQQVQDSLKFIKLEKEMTMEMEKMLYFACTACDSVTSLTIKIATAKLVFCHIMKF